MKKLVTLLIGVLFIIALFMMLGPLYIVNEGELAVVTRFGAIVRSDTEAGLKIKVPVIDTVVKYPKKILSWDGESQRLPTRENQFIWVDSTARWRIDDPIKFYESNTTLEQALGRLDEVIDSAVRTVIAENYLREAVRNSNIINEIERTMIIQTDDLPDEEIEEGMEDLRRLTETITRYEEVAKGRSSLSNEMLRAVSTLTPQYGIELIDIIIRQIRYSDDLTESVYNRMITERRQVAGAYRSFGEGKKAEWIGRLDNERRTLLSNAYARAEEIRGTADAEATKIYANAYERDPEFSQFWLTIESYRRTLPQMGKILTTDMEYFKYLYNQQGQ